jgi:hypothetical protein
MKTKAFLSGGGGASFPLAPTALPPNEKPVMALQGGSPMQAQQQLRHSPGRLLALTLALVAAATLGASAGYQLRALGFPNAGSPARTAPAVAAPAAAPAVAPASHYVEPDARDRSQAANPTPAPTQGPQQNERIPTHGPIP